VTDFYKQKSSYWPTLGPVPWRNLLYFGIRNESQMKTTNSFEKQTAEANGLGITRNNYIAQMRQLSNLENSAPYDWNGRLRMEPESALALKSHYTNGRSSSCA
jgi:hypothetical protein